MISGYKLSRDKSMLVTRARMVGMLPPGPNSFILVNQRGWYEGASAHSKGACRGYTQWGLKGQGRNATQRGGPVGG
ncbi:hypothetical protein CEXT_537101 [Caerostris extrusa]|uniref:Uncharacterized protein n=1 Tax=Caerostris extrusa TaxID=172846 RepID=A0AAV4V3R9_CAEEX|nr:hypothetical protein CEXT_537101 [Caerostris extrusa]